MKTVDYLDELNEKKGWTDYRIAKELGISRSTVSNYRVKDQHFRDDIAIHVAEILGIDPLKVVADAHAQRAKDDETKGFWQKIAGTAAAAIISLTILAQTTDIASISHASEFANNTDYTQLAVIVTMLLIVVNLLTRTAENSLFQQTRP
jgi:predicted transcriptional regulator